MQPQTRCISGTTQWHTLEERNINVTSATIHQLHRVIWINTKGPTLEKSHTNVISVNILQPCQAIWRHTESLIQEIGLTNAPLVHIQATISTVYRSTLGVLTLGRSQTSATNISKLLFHWVSSRNTLWHTVEKGNTNVTIHQLHQLMRRLTRGPTP